MKIEKVENEFRPYVLRLHVENAEQEDALKALAERRPDALRNLIDLPSVKFNHICDFLESLKEML